MLAQIMKLIGLKRASEIKEIKKNVRQLFRIITQTTASTKHKNHTSIHTIKITSLLKFLNKDTSKYWQ